MTIDLTAKKLVNCRKERERELFRPGYSHCDYNHQFDNCGKLFFGFEIQSALYVRLVSLFINTVISIFIINI